VEIAMQHTRHRHRTQDRQPDLFVTIPPPAPDLAAGWRRLPDRTRQAVTSLMTRLLVGHVADAAPAAGSDADER
jgi:hypothetical protein